MPLAKVGDCVGQSDAKNEMRKTFWGMVAVIAVGLAVATLAGGTGSASVASHAPEPQYQRACELRGQGLDRKYHLGPTPGSRSRAGSLGIAARILRPRSGDGRTVYLEETA